jgi:putative membrane protein (TIGR04086 family)
MSTQDEYTGAGSAPGAGSSHEAHVDERTTIPRPADEQVVYRAEPDVEVVGAQRRKFDLPATIGGALAALGTLLLLSSLLSAAVGAIGYQTGVDDQDLSVGGLIAGLVSLFIACLVGGWVAGRIARRRGGLHGLVSALWLVLLAALLAGLAAVAGDKYDVTERVGLPAWFDADALAPLAIGTGLLALALMLFGGWLGGKQGERHHDDTPVEVVQTRRAVREHRGGIRATGEGR